MMTPAMQNALLVLQMPALELGSLIQKEIDSNPLLEPINSHTSFSFPSINDVPLQTQTSLYDLLQIEIAYIFQTEEDLLIAEKITGNLNQNGHLAFPVEELGGDKNKIESVLKKIQQVAPPGVAAKNPQESLLLQINNKQSLAYKIIESCYNEFLQKRINQIQKKLQESEDKIIEAIYYIRKTLDPFPGRHFEHCPTYNIIPDATISYENDKWIIKINEHFIPKFSINSTYAKHNSPIVCRYIASGKWLLHTIERRKVTLTNILGYIISKQDAYLQGVTHSLTPMTMRELAKEISLNESTITRAVSGKYIATPRGVLELRKCFTSKLISREGESISNQTAKDLLMHLIEKENKDRPFSDKILSSLLYKQGIPCARRTVSKYRKELKIETAAKRISKKNY